jgi:hypothetical protein
MHLAGIWRLIYMKGCLCHNVNFGFAIKVRACEGVGQE